MVPTLMIDKARIALAPVGDTPLETVTEIGPILAARLDAKVVLAPGMALISSAYDAHRRQYHSTQILDALARTKQRGWERMLGIVDVDLYVPDLNFVFGEADMRRGVAVFSLARLRPSGSSENAHALFLKLAESDRKGSAFCAAHAAQLVAARSYM